MSVQYGFLCLDIFFCFQTTCDNFFCGFELLFFSTIVDHSEAPVASAMAARAPHQRSQKKRPPPRGVASAPTLTAAAAGPRSPPRQRRRKPRPPHLGDGGDGGGGQRCPSCKGRQARGLSRQGGDQGGDPDDAKVVCCNGVVVRKQPLFFKKKELHMGRQARWLSNARRRPRRQP